MANEQQARFWNEEGGPRWVAHDAWFDLMLEPYGAALTRSAAAQPGEQVLDIGCGFGTTTLSMADAVGEGGGVRAIDISETMVSRVRSRAAAAGVANVVAQVGDAQTDPLPTRRFDLAVSRFGVMFFDDPVAAFTNVHASLQPEGRLAFVCWQPMSANELGWALVKAMEPVTGPGAPYVWRPGPYAFGDGAFVREVLEDAEFSAVELESFEAPVVMGGGEGLDAAVDHCSSMSEVKRALGDLDPEAGAKAVALMRDALAARLVDGRVTLAGAAWIVTARA